MTTRKTAATTRSSRAKKPDDASEFMRRLEHPLKPEIEAVRRIILGANDRIREGLKWNSLSFHVDEYFATFHLRARDCVQLILHRGATVKAADAAELRIDDRSGLLEWLAKDRCTVKLTGMAHIEATKPALRSIVNQWIEQM